MEPLDEAAFLLRRLYPEMPEIQFVSVMHTLRERFEAGVWNGFRPPDD